MGPGQLPEQSTARLRWPFSLAILTVVGLGILVGFGAAAHAGATPRALGASPAHSALVVERMVREYMSADMFAEQVFGEVLWATMGAENRRLVRRSLTPTESATFEATYSQTKGQWRITVGWPRSDLNQSPRFIFHVLDNGTLWYVGRSPCYPGPWWPECG